MDAEQNESKSLWIQRLKDESWEAELLISTIAIVGTFQLFKLTDWGLIMAIDHLPESQYALGYGIAYMVIIAISILITILIMHFVLRAYWIGLVGLNSVYSDYDVKDSAYPEIYTRKILSVLPKLSNTIRAIDELCSVLFSVAFAMVVTYAYVAINTCLWVFLYNRLSTFINSHILLIPLYLFGIIIVCQMVVTIVAQLKPLRNNNRLQTWYFRLSLISNIILLGPLYKYVWQIFMMIGSNFRKNKARARLLLLFIFIGVIVSTVQLFRQEKIHFLLGPSDYIDNRRVYHTYYKSEGALEDFITTPQIDNDILETPSTRLFIPIYSYEKSIINNTCDQSNASDSTRSSFLQCYDAYIKVFKNEKPVDLKFMKYNMPSSSQFGIVTYVDLRDLPRGFNTLKVHKNIDGDMEWTIPFQYLSDE